MRYIVKVEIGQDVEITLDAIRGEKYHGQVTDIASLGKVENNIVTYEVTIEIRAGAVLAPALSQEADGRGEKKAGSRWKRGGSREVQRQKDTEGVRGLEFGVKRQEKAGNRQKAESRRLKADGWMLKAEEGISRIPNPEPRIPNPAFSTKKLKPGMTADVDIITDKKTDVLYVPLEAIVEHKGRKVVLVLKDGKFVPRKIKTGLQDETHVEVIEGLTEGEEVKLKSLTPKKGGNNSSGRSRMSGGPHGMGMMGRR